MREIKFRAWYEDEMHYNIKKHHIEHNALSGSSGDVWDFSDWLKYSKVMQSLKSKIKMIKMIKIFTKVILYNFLADLLTSNQKE